MDIGVTSKLFNRKMSVSSLTAKLVTLTFRSVYTIAMNKLDGVTIN